MKEKWKPGKCGGTVVSDTPNNFGTDDSVKYYGGYLVAESIPAQRYIHLITAAPEMLEACKFALSVQRSQGVFDVSERLNVERLEAAIAKAERGE